MVIKNRAVIKVPVSVAWIYGLVCVAFLGAIIWLGLDLRNSRTHVIAERTAMAVQTSRFMSQWYGTTITATDYVLLDVITRVTPGELDSAGSDPKVERRLSELVRKKLATLQGVFGLGFLDRRGVFVAAADERLVGIKSKSKLISDRGQVLDNRAYIEYVPATKSANKQPAILISRPLLSPEGHFLGGAVAAIVVSAAQDWIETFAIGKYNTMAMVDDNGILLAINPPKPAAIGIQLRYPSHPANLGDRRGSASFVAISPYDGRQRIYGLSKVENIPLSIIVGYDMAESLREWQRRVWQLAAGSLMLLLLLGVALRERMVAFVRGEEVKKLAITDPLTGVANRRQLISTGEREVVRAVRYQSPMSVLMVDIDHFKSINDTWGHPTGDLVIKALANAMTANVRDTDVVGRLGGEEFAAVLPETDTKRAFDVAERLREVVERSVVVPSNDEAEVRFTVSIGVASLHDGASSFEEVLGHADQALYAAKSGGRNQVVGA